MVKNPPANAGDTSSIPDLGRSHTPRSNSVCAAQLLSLCPGAREPQLLSLCAASVEVHTPSGPCSATREATAVSICPLTFIRLIFFFTLSFGSASDFTRNYLGKRFFFSFSSVASDSFRPHGLQHARLPCPSPTPGPCSNSCPSSW